MNEKLILSFETLVISNNGNKTASPIIPYLITGLTPLREIRWVFFVPKN